MSSQWMWGTCAAIALLWPSRLAAGLDGIPLDTLAEAVALGTIFPALWWLHPRFLRSTLGRAFIAALLLAKIAAVPLAQDGWCVSFDPPLPMVRGSSGKPHAWDVRADWWASDPACAAIMTRSYTQAHEFPLWFFNLPPPDDATTADPYVPPRARIPMTVDGFLDVPARGTLRLRTEPVMEAMLSVDGQQAESRDRQDHQITLSPGVHAVHVEAVLAGKTWSLIPSWNGAALGSMGFPPATREPPSRLDRLVRPAANWIVEALEILLLLLWMRSWAAWVHNVSVLAWTLAAVVCVSVVASQIAPELAAWYAAAVLPVSLAVRLPSRLTNMRGVFVLLGIPWLAFVAAKSANLVGRFTLYGIGVDNWTFQRHAYRIYLQGYWLEGGEPAFWFQPLYRWVVGALHVIFGDSSVGQFYFDAASVLVCALFAYRVTRATAGFRWGLVAAITTLTMALLGPTRELVGFGLSEIASAGFLSLAALFALRGRAGRTPAILAAGALATLAFYTRMNNLPMACGVAVFALPLTVPAGAAIRPATWWAQVSWKVAAGVLATLGVGLVLFAWRTWYYTGVFSVFHGTQFGARSLYEPGMPLTTLLERMGGSLMMVLTASDPPRYATHALPLLLGAVVSVAALAGVKALRDVPLPLVLFFLAGCAGSLVARGWFHEGRFSAHLLGVCSAVTVCAAAAVVRAVGASRNSRAVDSRVNDGTLNTILAIGLVIVLGQAVRVESTVQTLERQVAAIRVEVDDRVARLARQNLLIDRGEIVRAAVWLHDYYRSDEGLRRPDGLWLADQRRVDTAAIGTWLFDVYLGARVTGASDAKARRAVMEAIRKTDEWRHAHHER